MPSSTPTAQEIDRKLRDDFRRRLKDYGISDADPFLSVLSRTFAGQLEAQYQEVERLRFALLDELMAGLGIEQLKARPAQTVVVFSRDKGSEHVPAGTELVGEAENGHKLGFATDVSLTVSTACFAVAATYQNGSLRLVAGVEMPEQFQAARPSFEPVPASLGVHPAIFLAVENLTSNHLSGCGCFFDFASDAASIREALLHESWCLASPSGQFNVDGILHPRRSNAGVQMLEWLRDAENTGSGSSPEEAEMATLPDGFYGSRLFVFPEVPASRRFMCSIPKGLYACFSKIFGPAAAQLFATDRAWLRISMPREVADLYTGLITIIPHAVTASNVECLNQTIHFSRDGTSIPVSRKAGATGYLVAPLSVLGAGGSAYLPEHELSSDPIVGRYAIRNGRVELRPAHGSDGSLDTGVNLRLWITAGKEANGILPNQIRTFAKPGSFMGLGVHNRTSALGGTNEDTFQEAHHRFAEALLSRDRIVTRSDLLVAARALDKRIQAVDVSSGLLRCLHGLKRVERVKVWLDQESFLDPAEEGRILQDELKRHLQQRVLHDIELKVDLAWK